MYYHSNSDEINFFEKKRFSDEYRPTYREVLFILKDFEILSNEQVGKIQNMLDKRVKPEIWQRIKQVAYFDESSYPELQTLRAQVFSKNSTYQKLIQEGIVIPFEDFEFNKGITLKEALKDVEISTYSSMYEYFARGENIGTCGFSSKLIGVMFDQKSIICERGHLKAFEGTPASEKGQHAWIVVKHKDIEYVVDTSLCLMIPLEYAREELDYVPERAYPIKLAIEERSDEGDMLYSHYSFQDYPTKNKASYDLYRKNKELYKLKQKETKDMEI